MKKILSYGLLATQFLTVSALASSSSFNGFYIGAGIADYQTNTNISIDQENWYSSEVNFVGSSNFSANSPYFHGQMGYGHVFFNHLYFGGLGFADVGHGESSDVIKGTGASSQLQANVTTHLNNVYGGDLKMGLLITPKLLVYGLAGLNAQDFGGTVSFTAINGATPVGPGIDFGNGYRLGGNVGAGFEYMIMNDLSADLEWSYLVSSTSQFFMDIFDAGLVSNDQLNMSSNRILVGLNFRF